jgi:hypothetical protein
MFIPPMVVPPFNDVPFPEPLNAETVSVGASAFLVIILITPEYAFDP